jgi:hypothetical protein
MPMFICRLFATLSVSLALGLSAYAMKTLRVLACRPTKYRVKGQQLAESCFNCAMKAGVDEDQPLRKALADSFATISPADNSDMLDLIKPVENAHRGALAMHCLILVGLPEKLIAV